MATAQSTRSPSPLYSRPRTSETNPPTRRSFIAKPNSSRRFEPITPANSPSDFGRCNPADNSYPVKNSCKNFMSPTISAASKFISSPRKKPLVERNDPMRSSMLLSDGKVMFFSSMHQDSEQKSEPGSPQSPRIESNAAVRTACECLPVSSKSTKRVTFSVETESVLNDSSSMKLGTRLQNKDSCSYVSPTKSPVDVDSALPPYDPKTNYLSPRPRFLHYKPNPRIEILLNREKGLFPDNFLQLEEDHLISESFCDSESTEDSQTDDLQEEDSPVISRCEDTVIGLEQVEDAGDALVNESTVFGHDEEHHVSDASESLAVIQDPPADSRNNKHERKPWTISRFMCFLMLLTSYPAWTYLSLTYSPWLAKNVLEDSRFSKASIILKKPFIAATRAREEFLQFAANHRARLPRDLTVLVFRIAYEPGRSGKAPQLQYMNISDLQKDNMWNKEFKMSHGFNLEPPPIDDPEGDIGENISIADAFEEARSSEESYSEAIDKEENFENESASDDSGSLFLAAPDPASISELKPEKANYPALEVSVSSDYMGSLVDPESLLESRQTIDADTRGLFDSHSIMAQSQENCLYDEFSLTPVDLQSKHEGANDDHSEKESSLYQLAIIPLDHKIETAAATASRQGTTVDTSLVLSEEIASEHTVVGRSPVPELSTLQDVDGKYHILEASSILAALTVVALLIYQNKRSPVSSAGTSQRESLPVSSSTDSPSFGSFTTFERIPIKTANGEEEEIMTPVRRSSRIRKNLIGSPQ